MAAKTVLKWAVLLAGIASLVFAFLIFVLLGGSRTPLPGASHPIQELGFVGVLEQAETSEWQVSGGGGTVGGPNSNLLVGPGILSLDGNRLVEIDAGTPGATFCPELPGANNNGRPGSVCLVLGNFKAGTAVAEWFRAEHVWVRDDAYFVGRIVEFRDSRPVFDVTDVSFVLDLAPDATYVNCGSASAPNELPDADIYFGLATEGTAISIVECMNGYYD